VTVDEPALDGVRDLPGRAHRRRVAALADRVVNGRLGYVRVNGSGHLGPLLILGSGRGQDEPGTEQDARPAQADHVPERVLAHSISQKTRRR
jgi:hypothetical protein